MGTEGSRKHREMQEGPTSTGCCNCLCSQMLLLHHLPSKICLQSRYWITVRISHLALPCRKPSCNASHIHTQPGMPPLADQWRFADKELQTAGSFHSPLQRGTAGGQATHGGCLPLTTLPLAGTRPGPTAKSKTSVKCRPKCQRSRKKS